MNSVPLILIFLPIVFAMIIYLFKSRLWNYSVFLSQGITVFILIRYLVFVNGTGAHRVLVGGWSEGVGIALRNDSLSCALMVLGVFMWLIVTIYSWKKKKSDDKFWFFLLFLQGTFLGLVQTEDFFNMFIFLEAITILSTILITYKKDGYSVRSGLYYILFNSSGMIFFLLGIMIIYMSFGTLNMGLIGKAIRDQNLYGSYNVILAYIFLAVAFGVKSAFFPVFNWLPKAHGAAPSSISALLSGVLVKSGLYGFIRLNQIFGIDMFKDIFFLIGFITALSGVVFAVSQKDIKQILAFHTISQIGIILMGLSSMKGYGYDGGVLHIFNHAIFKSLLFLGSGLIINRYKTRKIVDIKGVFKNMPLVSVGLIIAILSITGAPLFNGNLSKGLIKYSFKGESLKVAALYLINIGTLVSMIKFSRIFFGSAKFERERFQLAHLGMVILAGVCVYLGYPHGTFIGAVLGIKISAVKIISVKSIFIYAVSAVVAFIVYKLAVVKELKILRKIRHSNLSFEHANALLVMFVFILIVVGFR